MMAGLVCLGVALEVVEVLLRKLVVRDEADEIDKDVLLTDEEVVVQLVEVTNIKDKQEFEVKI